MRIHQSLGLVTLALAACGAPSENQALMQEVGITSNGGQAVVCKDDHGFERFKTLDYFEAEHSWQFKLAFADGADWMQKARNMIKRLAKHDSGREWRYTKALESFNTQSKFVPGRLDIVNDNNGTDYPEDCAIVQAALRRAPELPGDSLYTISKLIWDKLNDDNKAGLVLHEIVLNEAIEQWHLTSRKARYFNASLASEGFESMPLQQYSALLETANLYPYPLTRIREGVELRTATITRFANGKISGGEIGKYVARENQRHDWVVRFALSKGFVAIGSHEEIPPIVTFTEDGKVKTARGAFVADVLSAGCEVPLASHSESEALEFDFNERVIKAPLLVNLSGGRVDGECEVSTFRYIRPTKFFDNGVPESATCEYDFRCGISVWMGSQLRSVEVPNRSSLHFHKSGRVKFFVYESPWPVTLTWQDGHEEQFKSASIELDENGKVVKAWYPTPEDDHTWP